MSSKGSEARYAYGDEPVWGSEAERILGLIARQLRRFSSTPDHDVDQIRSDAGRAFGRTALTSGSARVESELVVGRVQAGKTSNFTVVTGLARDNGYQLFIVLAGTKSELLDQTQRRLKKTLAAASLGALPAFWVQKLSIGNEVYLANELRNKLTALRNAKTASGQAPVLVVLKQTDNLIALQTVLENLRLEIPLETIPTMVIDDEADQASPDNRVRRPGDATSAVHAAVAGVRELLPWHSFLAYTATPQANLLMELNGLLHPRSVTVIDSGGDYVGVEELFGTSLPDYASEVLDTPPLPNKAPESLKNALATFLCQIALVRRYREEVIAEPLRSSEDPVTVTMLINPGSGTLDHETWRDLVDTVLDSWNRQFSEPLDIATARTVTDYFEPAWSSLVMTLHQAGRGANLPECPNAADLTVIGEIIAYIERRTINSVTARSGVKLPEDDEWNQQVAWLFVGGEILGRGQTLANLMTTYMPRVAGMGAIDTIQQRGRFYGYHAAYRPLLRGWFEPDTLELYRDAALSEAFLISDLEKLDRNRLPLSDWTRELLLGSGRLQVTRKSVIPRTAREFTQNEWAFSQAFILDPTVNSSNLAVSQAFVDAHLSQTTVWPGERRADPRDYGLSISTAEFLEFLNDWAATGPEIQYLADLGLLLGRLDEDDPSGSVSVALMDRSPSDLAKQASNSYRSLQGSRKGSASRDRIGNPLAQRQRRVVHSTFVTAQLHVFQVGDTATRQPGTTILATQAPSLVVHLPEELRQRVVTFDPRS